MGRGYVPKHHLAQVLMTAANPGRPNTLGYTGSEEFIRLQFEEYLLALLAAVKYHVYAETNNDNGRSAILDVGMHTGSLPLLSNCLTLY
jgi:hypothetical protein